MKKLLVSSTVITFSFLLFGLALGAKNDIEVIGNCTSGTYYKGWISITQLNSSVKSSQETFYRAKINISSTGTTAACTVEDLNYTLGDEKVVNDVNKIRLLASDLTVLQSAANWTYADGNYVKVRFNKTYPGYATVTNTTNTTFYIEFRLKPLDTYRTVTKTKNAHVTENITYYGPSDLNLENVTLIYKPTESPVLGLEVQYDGTTVTNYTYTSEGVIYDPDFAADSEHWLYLKYYTGETGKGATGAGRKPPLGVTPEIPSPAPWLALLFMSLAGVGFVVILLVYLLLKK